MPALTSDRVLLTHGSSLDSYAIDCTGDCLRWTRTLSPEPLDPVVDGSGPVVVRTGGTLLALDQADGATLWRAPLAGTLGREVAVANGTVYIASVDATGAGGVLQAFDADGCGAATCFPLADVGISGTGYLVLSDGRLFLAGTGRLLALAPG